MSGLNMIYPLADMLQMRLGLHQPKGQPARIVVLDPKPKKYVVTPAFSIDLKVEIKASFKSDKMSAVLVRVKGDMYLYLAYQHRTDELWGVVLDAGKMAFTPSKLKQIDGLHPKQVHPFIEPAIVATFKKKQTEVKWAREGAGNVGGVDAGQGRVAETGHSAPDSGVASTA